MQALATRFGAVRLIVAAIGLLTIAAGGTAVLVGSHAAGRRGHVISLDTGTQLAANKQAVRQAIAGGDAEAAQSFAESRTTAGGHAKAPNAASLASVPSPGAPTDAEVKRELQILEKEAGPRAPGGRAILLPNGQAEPPANAPDAVVRVINGGNQIYNFPYIWGGGHGSFQDSGYDCSGSVSYALAAAGLLKSPMVAADFENWGDPGPGKWITIEASGGHVYMYVAGLRFDTSGRSGPRGSRWQNWTRDNVGFVARHPPGL
ncbi:MAG: hypothetical protein JOZ25_02220 [Actinobacteria bacterium]|nr:hypothetical protein [Actinomycetota bacterium]